MTGGFSLSAALRRWHAWRGKGERFTPSPAELHQLTEHLYYEIQMTFDLADALIDLGSAQPRTSLELVVRNALLEAFTIHVRQLVDFFWGERPRRKTAMLRDAYAADYFDPEEWKQLRPARPQVLNRLVTGKVGWGVAHLTDGRAQSTLKDKEWRPVEMCAALAPVVRLFIDNVDQAKLDGARFVHIEPCLDRFEQKYFAGGTGP